MPDDFPCILQPGRFTAVILRRPDGRSYRYTFNPGTRRYEDVRPESTSWIYESLSGNQMIGVTGGLYTVQAEDGTREVYDLHGRITALLDSRFVGYGFTYLPHSNQLTSVHHTSGRSVTINWSGGRISSIVAANGKTVSYTYTGNRLTGVAYPDGLGTRTYHYEQSGEPNALTGYSINGVRKTVYAYDGNKRVVSSGMAGGALTDTFSYGSNYTDFTNPAGYTTRYNFTTIDGVRHVSSVSRPGSDTCAGGVAQTDYNADGYHTRKVDFEGNQTFFTWNNRGQLLEKRTGVGPAPGNSTANQQRTTYGWDTTRNLLNRRSRYGSGGSIQSETIYTYFPNSDTEHARLLKRIERCAPTCASGTKRTTTYTYVMRANEPPRESRRLDSVSHAAIASSRVC